MALAKLIVVVDEEVDVQDLSEVAWRVFNNIDARRDVVIMDGLAGCLGSPSPMPHYGGKMGIDATKKGPDEGHFRPWSEESCDEFRN